MLRQTPLLRWLAIVFSRAVYSSNVSVWSVNSFNDHLNRSLQLGFGHYMVTAGMTELRQLSMCINLSCFRGMIRHEDPSSCCIVFKGFASLLQIRIQRTSLRYIGRYQRKSFSRWKQFIIYPFGLFVDKIKHEMYGVRLLCAVPYATFQLYNLLCGSTYCLSVLMFRHILSAATFLLSWTKFPFQGETPMGCRLLLRERRLFVRM